MSDENNNDNNKELSAGDANPKDDELTEKEKKDQADREALDKLASNNRPMLLEDQPNLDVVLEIPVEISMEVGKTEMSIRNLLKLTQGSVVELDRYAGDPLDVFVNGTLVAHGEVVVVNDKFGMRLTDVISTAERIQKIAKS